MIKSVFVASLLGTAALGNKIRLIGSNLGSVLNNMSTSELVSVSIRIHLNVLV